MTPNTNYDSPIQLATPESFTTIQEGKDVTSLPLEKLVTSSHQPRSYFANEAMDSLIESVKKDGILQPILVRPVQDNYEIVAGERRYRAAQKAGLTKIPIICREMTDKEASEYALTENLQREDLNPIEETQGILKLLALTLAKSEEEVITLLNQKANSKRGITDNVVRNEDLQSIEEVFKRVGRSTSESFRSHKLPLLKLPANIVEATREGKIEYTKAKAIAKLKDEEQQSELLKEAIEDKLSLVKIKEKISKLTPSKQPNKSKVKIMQLSQELTKQKLWETNESKWGKVENLLDQINRILAENSESAPSKESVQKTEHDVSETLDFPLSQPRFTENSVQSPSKSGAFADNPFDS